MQPTISLIHPSRSRAKMALETLSKWATNAVDLKSIQYILSIDLDEPDWEGYGSLINYATKTFGKVAVSVSDNNNVVQAANSGAEMAKGKVLVLLSDDFDCAERWDEFILQNIDPNKEQALRVSDGLQADTSPILTLPIVTKKLYDKLQCLYYHEFTGMYADNWLYEKCKAMGCIRENFTKQFLHKHWINHHRPKDATAERHHNPKGFIDGKRILEEQRKINFGL